MGYQPNESIVVSHQWGVMLNDGEVVHMPTTDEAVAKAAAQSMIKSIERGGYRDHTHAVLVSRKVETYVGTWTVTP